MDRPVRKARRWRLAALLAAVVAATAPLGYAVAGSDPFAEAAPQTRQRRHSGCDKGAPTASSFLISRKKPEKVAKQKTVPDALSPLQSGQAAPLRRRDSFGGLGWSTWRATPNAGRRK